MKPGSFLNSAILVAFGACVLSVARAQVTTYTDGAQFQTAVSSGYVPPQVTNFDGLGFPAFPAAGHIINPGDTVQGTTFTYDSQNDLSGFLLNANSEFATTSGSYSLGTTGDNGFLSGDQFTMSFSHPEQAIGLYIISAGNNSNGDYSLGVSQGTAESSAVVDSTQVVPGGNVYFLGLVESNPSNYFTSATFASVAGLGIPFNIDDIMVTAGQPQVQGAPDAASTLTLLGSVSAALLGLRRRRRL